MSASLGSSSSEIRTNYLNLLVTQLQNQNPLEPMSNDQMASQLAQLSSLEQLEQINTTFSQVLLGQQANEAASLIGKQVSFFPPNEKTAVAGRVENVDMSTGAVKVKVGDYLVGLSDLQSISL